MVAARRTRRERREQRTWRRLDQAGAAIVGLPDESGIAREALAQATALFGAHHGELLLLPSAEGGGLVARIVPPAAGDGVEVTPLDPGQDPATSEPELEPTGGYDLVVPLDAAGRRLGRLSLATGRGRRGRRDARDRRRLGSAFGHMVATSLVALRRYDAQRRAAEYTRQEALRDPLTGLGNRSLLAQEAEELIRRSTLNGRATALLLLDLDGFKRINDTLGHAAGDLVLAEVGRRVTATLRETDLAVRLGGDEFALLTGDLSDPDDGERVAERLLAAIAPAIPLEEVEVGVRASIGIAVHGQDGDALEDLLAAADQAMYQAKASGPGQWRRSQGGGSDAGERSTQLLTELRAALAGDQLVPHYQPQVDTRTGAVTGFEALLRWQHPTRGLLPPSAFVPVAERSGLIADLTLRVLELALADHAELRRAAPDAAVSINISARNLLGQGLVDDIQRRLARSGVPASQLTLEITEPAPHPSPAVLGLFTALRGLGCKVSVHEFGAGQSSLTALTHYPAIREIKIEPGLVRGVADDPATARVVRAMVNMAHGLDVRVVAEGVESADLVARLRDLGCDALQGFHIQRPAPRAEIEAWLAGWPARRAAVLGLPAEHAPG